MDWDLPASMQIACKDDKVQHSCFNLLSLLCTMVVFQKTFTSHLHLRKSLNDLILIIWQFACWYVCPLTGCFVVSAHFNKLQYLTGKVSESNRYLIDSQIFYSSHVCRWTRAACTWQLPVHGVHEVIHELSLCAKQESQLMYDCKAWLLSHSQVIQQLDKKEKWQTV